MTQTDAPEQIWAEPDGGDLIIHNGAKNLEALISTGYLFEYTRSDLVAAKDATIANLVEALEWRPIETAPKDGTAIFLYWPHWHHLPLVGYVSNYMWTLVAHSIPIHDCHIIDGENGPTHWMSLPDTPAFVRIPEGGK